MVLEHIADSADRVVERAPPLDVNLFRHRDLHAAHVVPVPNRLKQRVGEAEHEEIFDGLLAQVVVDSEDAVLGKDRVQCLVEFDSRVVVAAEGLLDDDAPAVMQVD